MFIYYCEIWYIEYWLGPKMEVLLLIWDVPKEKKRDSSFRKVGSLTFELVARPKAEQTEWTQGYCRPWFWWMHLFLITLNYSPFCSNVKYYQILADNILDFSITASSFFSYATKKLNAKK